VPLQHTAMHGQLSAQGGILEVQSFSTIPLFFYCLHPFLSPQVYLFRDHSGTEKKQI